MRTMLIMFLRSPARNLRHIAGDGRHGAVLVAVRIAAEMREDRHVLGLPQRIVGRQRLLREHVERGAGDLSRFQRLDQRRLVDHAAARDIDQIGGRLHGGEHLRADDAARLRRQRRQRHQDSRVRARSSPDRRARPCGRSLAPARGLPLMPITVMPNCLQIGARYSAISPTPRMPTVLPASSCAGQRSHWRFVLRAGRARQVARQRQHIGDGRFRHRRAVDAADIGDQHLFAERGQVDDVVDAGAERLDPFQLRASRTTWSAIGGEKHSRMSVSAI